MTNFHMALSDATLGLYRYFAYKLLEFILCLVKQYKDVINGYLVLL